MPSNSEIWIRIKWLPGVKIKKKMPNLVLENLAQFPRSSFQHTKYHMSLLLVALFFFFSNMVCIQIYTNYIKDKIWELWILNFIIFQKEDTGRTLFIPPFFNQLSIYPFLEIYFLFCVFLPLLNIFSVKCFLSLI